MNTPRTDAERRALKKSKSYPADPVSAEFARKLEIELQEAHELLREIRDGEVNAQDESDKYLRDHIPSKLAAMTALADRLAEALGTCAFKDWFKSQQTGQISVVLDAVKVREALAAYEAHKKGNTL